MKSIRHKMNYLISGLDRNGLLPFLNDKDYVSIVFFLKTGKRLNLKSPSSFNEKLQWLKVYDHRSEYTDYVDKIKAKSKVGGIIGEKYIVPLLGVWDNAQDIDYDSLPPKFVLKCNHDQGSVIVVSDKKLFDKNAATKFLNERLKHNAYYGTREYAYKDIRPQVFAEEYLGGSICDYKFYCFNGEPKFLYVGRGLTIDHSLKIDFFDMDWKPMPFYRLDYDRLGMVDRPLHFDEMKEIAKILSKDMPFVRIDLFEENDQIYFSEFTLCPASGYMPFYPPEYDEIVGKWLDLKK